MSNLLVQNIKHTNNTTAMVVDTTGRVTQPKKPAFQATVNSDAWATLSDNGIVPFNDTTNNNSFDVGGDFDTSNYRFVAPVAGKYQFSFLCYTFNSDNVNAYDINKNGSALTSSSSGAYTIQGGQASGSVDATISGTVIADLNASDYIDVRATTGSDYYGTFTHFSGHLIG